MNSSIGKNRTSFVDSELRVGNDKDFEASSGDGQEYFEDGHSKDDEESEVALTKKTNEEEIVWFPRKYSGLR
jgi:hypothetical protein